jgi:hypothetical protein
MRERLVSLQRYGMGDELVMAAYRAAVTLAEAAKDCRDAAGHLRWLEVADRLNPHGEAPLSEHPAEQDR